MENQIVEARPFYHNESIQYGYGRILYSGHDIANDGIYRDAGWVLPGGRRTADRSEAFQAAMAIDRLTKTSSVYSTKRIDGWLKTLENND